MTVLPIRRRKEMDFERKKNPQFSNGNGMDGNGNDMNFGKSAPPSNDAPTEPQMGQQPQPVMDVPDHTHPEYDELLVKMQEIEEMLQNMQSGGISQESLDEGKPEKDKGKPTGKQEPISDTQGNQEIKKVESLLRKIIREELKGVPEMDRGKTIDKSGPNEINNISQSKQPGNGEAPSGGGFDSDDKTNEEDGDGAISETPKPKNEFPKATIKKNKLNEAKVLIECAKRLMKEADEDPTEPNPGETEKNPKKMDGQVPNKSPTGGTEKFDDDDSDDDSDEGSDDEKNGKSDGKRPIMKEGLEGIYNNLKKEIKQEARQEKRQSMVGMSALSNDYTEQDKEEYLTMKEKASNTIKEYLVKAGHSRALGFMIPPTIISKKEV